MTDKPLPTPDQLRAEMSAGVANDVNAGIESGSIFGQDVIAVPGNPVPEANEPAPEPTPEPQPEATPPVAPEPVPAEGKIFGKYNDMEAANNGYFSAVNKLSSVLDENTALKQRLAATESTSQAAATVPGSSPGALPRVNPVAPRESIDWSQDAAVARAAEEVGADPAVFGRIAEAVYNRTAEAMAHTVEQQVQATVQPMQQATEAESYIRAEYPEAYNHMTELQNFVRTTPVVQEGVEALMGAGNQKAAMEYAIQMYAAASGVQLQKTMEANSEVAEAERVEARAAAGLPKSQ